MQLRVTHFGEAILRKPGKVVTVFNPGLEALAEDMLETMQAHEGIGLAAQQVDLPSQICVVNLGVYVRDRDFAYSYDGKQPPLELLMPLIFVNPVVVADPSETLSVEEGCLSFPEICGVVERPANIKVVFQDLTGARHELVCDGILARVIQHEVDHLNGILFIDRMDACTLDDLAEKLGKLKTETQQWIRKLEKRAETDLQ